MSLSAPERAVLTTVADTLIPTHPRRPSASGAQVPHRWIDAALAARPDLAEPLREALAELSDLPAAAAPAAVFARLQRLAPERLATLGTLTAGAYFLNPEIRDAIGYPGQESRPFTAGTDLPYLDLLERVVERGPIYQPTVDSVPGKGSTVAQYVQTRSVSLDYALQLVGAAVAAAGRIGGAYSVAVLDESGNVKASARMDGAGLSSVQLARDKAYTVVATGMTPAQWFEYSETDPRMAAGRTGMERVVTFDGGLPIVADGIVIGALGVSGGHYEQDLAVATAALAEA